MVSVTDNDYCNKFMKDLWKQTKEGITTDSVLEFEGFHFNVHSCVLKIASPSLLDELCVERKNSHKVTNHQNGEENGEISPSHPDITAEMFERILRFLYTGQIEIAEGDFRKVEEFSTTYKIQSLVEICKVYKEKEDELDKADIAEPVTVVVESSNSPQKLVKTPTKKFNCLDCDRTFSNSSCLSEHYALFRHGPLEEIPPCNDCGAPFLTKDEKIKHICQDILNKMTSDKRPDTCSYCSMKCDDLLTLRDHEKAHQCDKCNKVFNSIEICALHTCGHRSEKLTFECVECKKVYTSKQCFTNHQKAHLSDESLTCQYCGKKFLHRLPMKKHILSHTEAGNLKHICRECGAEFRQKIKLYAHCINFSHMLHEVPYKCQTCGKLFTNDRDLNSHFRTHTPAKPFQCGECDKTYSSKLGLKLHINSQHLKKATHECLKCGRKFAQSSHLHDHMRTHSIEKRHVCSFCGLAVSSKINLKRHESKHTGNKALVCHVCHKSFVVPHDLKRHMKSHRVVNIENGTNSINDVIQGMLSDNFDTDMDTT